MVTIPIFARSSFKVIEFPLATVTITFLFLQITLPFGRSPMERTRTVSARPRPSQDLLS